MSDRVSIKRDDTNSTPIEIEIALSQYCWEQELGKKKTAKGKDERNHWSGCDMLSNLNLSASIYTRRLQDLQGQGRVETYNSYRCSV